jgi:hypothetical protein
MDNGNERNTAIEKEDIASTSLKGKRMVMHC